MSAGTRTARNIVPMKRRGRRQQWGWGVVGAAVEKSVITANVSSGRRVEELGRFGQTGTVVVPELVRCELFWTHSIHLLCQRGRERFFIFLDIRYFWQ